ncbi:MAG: succinylglutamate desuccinylase/aspartoacylase family protein [Betaproteobacteria bacterium]
MAKSALEVGTMTAGTGEKRYGVNEFTVDGRPYRLPMWLVNGRDDGPTLAVTAGVHAAEYASIAAALALGRSLDPAALAGRVIVLPVMNLPSFAARSIYVCPLDGKNLNRVFPGNAQGTASEQIAAWVFDNVIGQADYYVDLHGGDLVEALVPFTIFFRTGDGRVDRTSLEMAKSFGIHYLVCSETPGSTLSAASRAGIPSILAESGGQGIWAPEDVARHTEGLDRLMRHLGMIPGAAPEPAAFTLLEQFLWLRSDHDAFWYPGVPVAAHVMKGQDLGCVQDAEGRVLQTAVSPADGRVLFIVSSLAINRGDPLLAVGA